MFGYVLQDWITIRGGTAGSPAGDIIQGESTWMGFSSFQDIVFWLDVREATISTSQSLTFYFETSPSKDSNLFVAMKTPSTGLALTPSYTPGVQLDGGVVPRVILANTSGPPLATWVRWRIAPSAGITLPWDATFRILVAANRVVREAQPQATF